MATLMQMKAQLLRAFKLIYLTTYKSNKNPLVVDSQDCFLLFDQFDSDHVTMINEIAPLLPGSKGS